MRYYLKVVGLLLSTGVFNSVTINVPAGQPSIHADIDGSCTVDISDLAFLVDYMFTGGPAPLVGCE